MRREGGICKVLCQKSICGRWRGAWARAGWRVWDLGNGTIVLQKLFNPEWQITSKPLLLSSFLIGFSFLPTAEISRLGTWVWRKFAAENRVNFQRGDWTGVKRSSQSRKTKFLSRWAFCLRMLRGKYFDVSNRWYAPALRIRKSQNGGKMALVLNKFFRRWK